MSSKSAIYLLFRYSNWIDVNMIASHKMRAMDEETSRSNWRTTSTDASLARHTGYFHFEFPSRFCSSAPNEGRHVDEIMTTQNT